jgi:hypothetical protein
MFDVDIPCDDETHEHIAFCVCYRAGPESDQREYWDSNGGNNYSLMSAERRRRIDTRAQPIVHPYIDRPLDTPNDAPRTGDAWLVVFVFIKAVFVLS